MIFIAAVWDQSSLLTATLNAIIILGVGQMCGTKMAPPGAAENEIEQFWPMEMVDMVITKKIMIASQKGLGQIILFGKCYLGAKFKARAESQPPQGLPTKAMDDSFMGPDFDLSLEFCSRQWWYLASPYKWWLFEKMKSVIWKYMNVFLYVLKKCFPNNENYVHPCLSEWHFSFFK